MRRWPTWLVVGALVALGAFAAADALREGGTKRIQEKSTRGALIPPNEPAGSAMNGVLYYTDEGCVLRALELPNLHAVQAPRWRHCHFSMAPHEALLGDPRAIWSPEGGIYAVETRTGIKLASPASAETIAVHGHAPAFMPDGTFTYARHGSIVAWTTTCPPGAQLFTLPNDNATARCAETLFDRRTLGFAVPTDSPRIAGLVWLSLSRVAAVLGVTSPPLGTQEYISVLEGRRTVASIGRGIDLRIEASPRGGYFAAWFGDQLFTIRDRNGDAISFPPLRDVRALAWSPDERWTAAATAHSVYVFRTNEGEARLRRLDIQAHDLAWR